MSGKKRDRVTSVALRRLTQEYVKQKNEQVKVLDGLLKIRVNVEKVIIDRSNNEVFIVDLLGKRYMASTQLVVE